MISEAMKARRKAYDDAVSELHSYNPEAVPVARYGEVFAIARVQQQAREARPKRTDLGNS
jgi:hypothetical protein